MGAPSPELCNLGIRSGSSGVRTTRAGRSKCIITGWKHRKLPDGTWAFFIDHPFGADPSWAFEAPPATNKEPGGEERAIVRPCAHTTGEVTARRRFGDHLGTAGHLLA